MIEKLTCFQNKLLSNLVFHDYFLREKFLLFLLRFQFLFLFVMIISVAVSPAFFVNSFAQEMSPHQQWKKFADLDMLTCKSGKLLLQKINGNPTCVMPSTYLKLIDRGYGNHNQSLMEKNSEMMNDLKTVIASNHNIMLHWHEMMQNNPNIMSQTMIDWVSQIKDKPELLKNMLGPMTSDPELRKKMIEVMKNHSHMEASLKQNSTWMDSIHDSMMDSKMESGIHHQCSWCPVYQKYSKSHSMNSNETNSHQMGFSNYERMMDMIHHMWINSKITKDIHTMMLENPSHMAMMSDQMMEPMLDVVMDDPELREQMTELMLQHKDFMNSIRHDNSETDH